MDKNKYQEAWYAHNDEQFEELAAELNLSGHDWVTDTVVGDVTVYDNGKIRTSGTTVGKLRFCYAFPHEIEILTYLDGPHWHMNKQEFKEGRPFLSHIGFHLFEGEEAPSYQLLQTMHSVFHTSPEIRLDGRRYYYEIRKGSACDLKYIWRK